MDVAGNDALYVGKQLWFLEQTVNITITHKELTQIIISAFILNNVREKYCNISKISVTLT
jgi:aminopeptidase C